VEDFTLFFGVMSLTVVDFLLENTETIESDFGFWRI
jgi:hypothetical protein